VADDVVDTVEMLERTTRSVRFIGKAAVESNPGSYEVKIPAATATFIND
jgi:hypothetical protein